MIWPALRRWKSPAELHRPRRRLGESWIPSGATWILAAGTRRSRTRQRPVRCHGSPLGTVAPPERLRSLERGRRPGLKLWLELVLERRSVRELRRERTRDRYCHHLIAQRPPQQSRTATLSGRSVGWEHGVSNLLVI